jgi:hypothetical protein
MFYRPFKILLTPSMPKDLAEDIYIRQGALPAQSTTFLELGTLASISNQTRTLFKREKVGHYILTAGIS